MPVANCANCGARLPEESRFCPECGVRRSAATGATAVEEVPPEETGSVPVHTVAVAPRYFGVAPPLALFALAVAALVLGIVLLVTGHAIAGARRAGPRRGVVGRPPALGAHRHRGADAAPPQRPRPRRPPAPAAAAGAGGGRGRGVCAPSGGPAGALPDPSASARSGGLAQS